MSQKFELLRNIAVAGIKFALYDSGVTGSMRYRLMRHNTISGRYDTWTSSVKHEFENTIEEAQKGNWTKWKEPHGHQVIKENEDSSVVDLVYQRLPPHEWTPKSPKGEVIKDNKK